MHFKNSQYFGSGQAPRHFFRPRQFSSTRSSIRGLNTALQHCRIWLALLARLVDKQIRTDLENFKNSDLFFFEMQVWVFSGDVDGTEIIGFVRKPIFDRDCLGFFVRNVPPKNLTAFLGIGFIYSFVDRKATFFKIIGERRTVFGRCKILPNNNFEPLECKFSSSHNKIMLLPYNFTQVCKVHIHWIRKWRKPFQVMFLKCYGKFTNKYYKLRPG